MSVSTDGKICFGVLCEEDYEPPWMTDVYEGEIEKWWFAENEFKDIYEPFTKNGHYSPGWSRDDDRFDAYFENRRQWLRANPIPVELENYCSDSDPMFAITVPGSTLKCDRGYPQSFHPGSLVVTTEQIQNLVSFLNQYNIKYDDKPRWLLISFWG